MRSFYEIACSVGTDKAERHGYHIPYEKHFSHLRGVDISLAEIGVLSGASLRLWEEYFPKARIVGVDCDPRCKAAESTRSKVCIGDQKDIEFLSRLLDEGPFNIIVDDGSHLMEDQKVSFFTLFPHLPVGGFYVIEDLESSYFPEYGGGVPNYKGTMVAVIKSIIDDINVQYHKGEIQNPVQVSSMHIYRNIAFFVRGADRT